MSQVVPAGLMAHFRGERLTTALCWAVTKSDGEIIRGTSHDRDVTIDAPSNPPGLHGTYRTQASISGTNTRSGTDLSVDNMEVEGAVETLPRYEITVEEMESGVLDSAPVVVFQCNWARPNDGQRVFRCGTLGDITRDSDGKYNTEIRGLSQYLQQTIGTTYGERCDVVRFGDARCGYDVSQVTISAPVATVTDRRHLTLAHGGGELHPGFFRGGGVLTFTSGDNDGFDREVKRVEYGAGSPTGVVVELWDETPAEPAPADNTDLQAGCDRRYTTCRDVYQNIINFRGAGVFIPGALKMMAGPAPVTDCTIPLPVDDEA